MPRNQRKRPAVQPAKGRRATTATAPTGTSGNRRGTTAPHGRGSTRSRNLDGLPNASSPPSDATNGMEPDDGRCVGACSDVLRDEHEIVDCDGSYETAHVVHHRHMSHLSVTHPAEGLLRRLVDVSRVKIPVPVRSWPKWSRRIPTRIRNGIGQGHARVFMIPAASLKRMTAPP